MTPEQQARFDAMWRDFSPAVLRYARRRVAPGDVDDVVADTFLVAWRRLEEAPAFALPWLLGVARNVCAGQRRTGRRRAALHERLAAQPEEHVVPGPEAPHGVAAALDRLGERDREVLTLIAWDGLTPAEAAQALSVSQTALRVRLHRARRRFAALLSEVTDAGSEVSDSSHPDATPRSGRTAPLTTACDTTLPGGS